MKKILTIAVMMMVAGSVMAADWTGTRVGSAVKIADDVDGGIVIGDGSTNGFAQVTANNACQIGIGSNGVANTIKYRGAYLYTNASNGAVSAGDIAAGTMANAMVISNAATKIYCYTNISTDATVSGKLLSPGASLISNAASKVYCYTNVCTSFTVIGTPGFTKSANAAAVDVVGGISNAPAGTLTNMMWFGIQVPGSTNYYVVPGFQSTAL
jgi:hypothetical protein